MPATRIGALTTIFTPPSSCVESSSNFNYNFLETPVVLVKGPNPPKECLPDRYDATTRLNYYSPGICPAGYSNACFSISASGTVTETTAVCCPSEYHCGGQDAYGCESTFATWSGSVTVLSGGTTISVTSTTTVIGAWNAYGVAIRYKSGDFPITTQSSSLPSSTLPPSQTSMNIVSSSQIRGGGISPGAAAGAGVGGVLGLLVIIGAVWMAFILGRRSSRRKQHSSEGISSNINQKNKSQNGSEHLPIRTTAIGEIGEPEPRELRGHQINEAPT